MILKQCSGFKLEKNIINLFKFDFKNEKYENNTVYLIWLCQMMIRIEKFFIVRYCPF